MQAFLVTVGAAVLAGIILWLIGVGRGVKVSVHGSRSRKTGKWMVLIAWSIIIFGFVLCGQNALPQGGWDLSRPGTAFGLGFLELGIILLVIGSIVAWFQRN